MCPSSFHYMIPNLLTPLERLALGTVAKGTKNSMALTHLPCLEGHSRVVLPNFNKQSIPTLTHLLDVPVFSTMGPIPVQSPH